MDIFPINRHVPPKQQKLYCSEIDMKIAPFMPSASPSPRGKTRLKLAGKWIGALCFLGLAVYPIIIKPMMDSSDYKEMQKIGRQGIVQEKIQPGNMKVWSDPFVRNK